MDDPRNPHHGISHDAVLSWFAPIVPTRVIAGNRGYRQRLICTFENLDWAALRNFSSSPGRIAAIPHLSPEPTGP